jgi:L-arabinose transport system substrate-binding protein
MRLFKAAMLAGTVAFLFAGSALAADVKIGFIVKQPEEPWFQDEWKFADIAAKEKGFTVVKIGAEDGEKSSRQSTTLAHRASRVLSFARRM